MATPSTLGTIELSSYDPEIQAIVDYVLNYSITSEEAWNTARFCLMDSLACHFLALTFPECTKLLGPVVPGTTVPQGARVPGTTHVLDPVKAAFDIGCGIRWLDYNDTWLAAEWGHPSDNLGALLAVSDFVGQRSDDFRGRGDVLRGKDLLAAMIKAHEIQGILALQNAFNRKGIDHVVLVKIASSALASYLLGGAAQQIAATLSHAWLDGHALRTYRHAPNAGPRKSWAAGDATSRAVRLAMMVHSGEQGYPSALSVPVWGVHDALLHGDSLVRDSPYSSYVMEQILFKISFPAEFHAQTAVEAALALSSEVQHGLDRVSKVLIHTQEPAIRIIAKDGPLHNPAARDHCLQYMVAIGLLYGDLKAEHYEDDIAANPAIDSLREKMEVVEDTRYTKDYYDPSKRSIANALQLHFVDGTTSKKVEIEYPVGHHRRRVEGIPLLTTKAATLFRSSTLQKEQASEIHTLLSDHKRFMETPLSEFFSLISLVK